MARGALTISISIRERDDNRGQWAEEALYAPGSVSALARAKAASKSLDGLEFEVCQLFFL